MNVCQFAFANSISAHDYSKLFLWKTYTSVKKFHIICLLKPYPDSTVPHDDDTLVTSSYNQVSFKHPSNTKHACVCLYCKIYLPLRVLNIGYLNKSANFELMIGYKSFNFVLFRSPSQSQDEFKTFFDKNDVRNSKTIFFSNDNFWQL